MSKEAILHEKLTPTRNAMIEARRRVQDTDAMYRRQGQTSGPMACGAYIAATKAEQEAMRRLLLSLEYDQVPDAYETLWRQANTCPWCGGTRNLHLNPHCGCEGAPAQGEL